MPHVSDEGDAPDAAMARLISGGARGVADAASHTRSAPAIAQQDLAHALPDRSDRVARVIAEGDKVLEHASISAARTRPSFYGGRATGKTLRNQRSRHRAHQRRLTGRSPGIWPTDSARCFKWTRSMCSKGSAAAGVKPTSAEPPIESLRRRPTHHTVEITAPAVSLNARERILCDRPIHIGGRAQHEIFHFSRRTDRANDHRGIVRE